jgi:hypothetical protein
MFRKIVIAVTAATVGVSAISMAAGCASQNAANAQSATTAAAPAKAKKKAKAKPEMTVSQKNAIESAKNYLNFASFSRVGLINQLSSSAGEGFPKRDAVYAVNHIDVNWNEQAAKAAKQYLKLQAFSRSGLIEQLESKAGDGYTHAQAVYGVNKTGL